jgi:hypothetical protein
MATAMSAKATWIEESSDTWPIQPPQHGTPADRKEFQEETEFLGYFGVDSTISGKLFSTNGV